MSALKEGQWNQGLVDLVHSCRTASLGLGVNTTKAWQGNRGIVCAAGRVTLGIHVADRRTSLPKTLDRKRA